MTHDERDSQLSAMFDGELPEPECELLARRLARDGELRRQWASHALVGAVIRREPLYLRRGAAGMPVSTLASRVSAALAAEPAGEAQGVAAEVAIAAGEAPRRVAGGGARRWLRPAVGVGIAAGVAALSIGLMRSAEIGSPAVVAAGFTSGGDPAAVNAAAGEETPVVGSVAAEVAAPVPASVVAAPPAEGEVVLAANSLEPESYVVPAPATAPGGMLPAAQLANYVVAHSEFSTPLSRRSVLSALVANDEAAAPAVPAADEARTGTGR